MLQRLQRSAHKCVKTEKNQFCSEFWLVVNYYTKPVCTHFPESKQKKTALSKRDTFKMILSWVCCLIGRRQDSNLLQWQLQHMLGAVISAHPDQVHISMQMIRDPMGRERWMSRPQRPLQWPTQLQLLAVQSGTTVWAVNSRKASCKQGCCTWP